MALEKDGKIAQGLCNSVLFLDGSYKSKIILKYKLKNWIASQKRCYLNGSLENRVSETARREEEIKKRNKIACVLKDQVIFGFSVGVWKEV